ncbi:MAG: hypothetical protein WB919_21130, partial [Candidatus Sulfotelmatobacter sp.]
VSSSSTQKRLCALFHALPCCRRNDPQYPKPGLRSPKNTSSSPEQTLTNVWDFVYFMRCRCQPYSANALKKTLYAKLFWTNPLGSNGMVFAAFKKLGSYVAYFPTSCSLKYPTTLAVIGTDLFL